MKNNSITLIGNLTRDPDIIEGKTGKFGSMRIAVNSKMGSNESVLFINIKAHGGAFRDLEHFNIKSGDRVLVEGVLVEKEFVRATGEKASEHLVFASSILRIAARVEEPAHKF